MRLTTPTENVSFQPPDDSEDDVIREASTSANNMQAL